MRQNKVLLRYLHRKECFTSVSISTQVYTDRTEPRFSDPVRPAAKRVSKRLRRLCAPSVAIFSPGRLVVGNNAVPVAVYHGIRNEITPENGREPVLSIHIHRSAVTRWTLECGDKPSVKSSSGHSSVQLRLNLLQLCSCGAIEHLFHVFAIRKWHRRVVSGVFQERRLRVRAYVSCHSYICIYMRVRIYAAR